MDKSPNRRPLTMRQFLTEVGGLVGAGRGDRPRPEGRRIREDDDVLGRLARGAEAGPAGGRGAWRSGTGAPAPAPSAAQEATPPVGLCGDAAPWCRDAAAGRSAPDPRRRDRRDRRVVASGEVPAAGTPMPGGAADAGRQPEPVRSDHAAAGLRDAAAPGDARRTDARADAQAGRRGATSARRSGSRRATSTRWSPRRAPASKPRARKGIAVRTRTPRWRPPSPRSRRRKRRRPLDERYVDDGSVTADDRKKFSLRSGGTSTALPTVGGAMPGERMSDAEVMGEIGGKKNVSSSSPSRLSWRR